MKTIFYKLLLLLLIQSCSGMEDKKPIDQLKFNSAPEDGYFTQFTLDRTVIDTSNSPYLKTIFATNMKEQITKTITFNHISKDHLKLLVKDLQTHNLEEKDLKLATEKFYEKIKKLPLKSAVELLYNAYDWNSQALSKALIFYFAQRMTIYKIQIEKKDDRIMQLLSRFNKFAGTKKTSVIHDQFLMEHNDALQKVHPTLYRELAQKFAAKTNLYTKMTVSFDNVIDDIIVKKNNSYIRFGKSIYWYSLNHPQLYKIVEVPDQFKHNYLKFIAVYLKPFRLQLSYGNNFIFLGVGICGFITTSCKQPSFTIQGKSSPKKHRFGYRLNNSSSIYIYDVDALQPIGKLQFPPMSNPYLHKFNTEEEVFVSNASELYLVNLNNTIVQVYQGHDAEITCARKITSRKIATCSLDRTFRIWNIATGECLKNIPANEDFTHIFPLKTKLALGNDNFFSTFNLHTHEFEDTPITNPRITITREGMLLYNNDTSTCLFDTEENQTISLISPPVMLDRSKTIKQQLPIIVDINACNIETYSPLNYNSLLYLEALDQYIETTKQKPESTSVPKELKTIKKLLNHSLQKQLPQKTQEYVEKEYFSKLIKRKEYLEDLCLLVE